MKVSFKWLQEYVDIDITPEELADRLTNAGVTVEYIEHLNKGVAGVVVGEVLEVVKHPNAEKLSLCQVTTDGDNHFQVVCGAPNVRTGQKIPFALVGAELPGGLKIKQAKLRGTESQGMICSAQELGINEEGLTSDQKEGILDLDPTAPLGMDIIEYLSLDDCVLEFDLTPNRSDCLSVMNIAREVAALLGKEVKLPEIKFSDIEKKIEDLAEVEIKDSNLCRRYVAKIVEGVQIKPSPQWLKHKLICAGMRPINNVVDITNYVLMEMGQPLHAFDYNYLSAGKIIVRKAEKGEKITTLDENERELTEDMLLITDSQKAVGIAGVMGGLNSEVTHDTTTVLIESAYFNPSNIRRTSTSLGLRSEASLRFEKGINIETVVDAANRTAQLLAELADGKVLKGIIDNYPNPIERTKIKLELTKVNEVLGTNINDEQIKEILSSLNINIIEENGSVITLEIPPYRPDITIAEDLIEEVARLAGYDNIPTTLPFGASSKGQKTLEQKLRDKIIDTITARGLTEVISFSFINKTNFDKLLISEGDIRRQAIPVLNPLSEEQGYMRTTLFPGLLDILRRNINRRSENLGIFELGKIYLPQGFPEKSILPQEKWTLGIALRGELVSNWQDKAQPVDFYYLKGIVEDMLEQLKITDILFKPCQDSPLYHPGRSAYVYVSGEMLGIIGEVHPQVADNYDLAARNYAAELDVELLIKLGHGPIKFKQLPRYPAVHRDLALVVKEEVTASQLMEVIWAEGGDLLSDVTIFDLYKGNQIALDYKSLAFALTFQAENRTLTDIEINDIHEKIQKALAEKFQASLRS
ncbi:MAG: phenylalanyl-tRNA synthetase subunit beta [Peptococcaceae bacterium BICA1-8]|nr:MAG: phenylalanyl-tRNA synthetase subunit beta [Peptococcaceae bacterium BICA1-8]